LKPLKNAEYYATNKAELRIRGFITDAVENPTTVLKCIRTQITITTLRKAIYANDDAS
jgi:hypothetical protein